MLSRRTALLAPIAAAPIAAQLASTLSSPLSAANTKMTLCMHQQTSAAAGFRASLEGWAKAGIKNVEISESHFTGWLKTETPETGKKLLGDLGLTAVSCQSLLNDLWIPGPAHAMSLETLKTRCEQYSKMGLQKIYVPSTTNRKVTMDDYKGTAAAIHEAGDVIKQFNMTGMIEFARTSTHLATLSSAVKYIREANHPNVRPMLDFFHFWSGLSKFEDLDMLQNGELAHVHYQDIADVPKEMYDNNSRVIPGDGIAPVAKILQKLSDKGYAGPLSVELFLANLTGGDPQMVAAEIKRKGEAVMKTAGVL